MPTETIVIAGKRHLTLRELLRPELRAVFVGINPVPKSVDAGHYHQGRLGKLLWRRLQRYGIVSLPVDGWEDEAAFRQGIGFADMVRRPSPCSRDLSRTEIREVARLLVQRLSELGEPKPTIVFVYALTARECESSLERAGFATLGMPSLFEKREIADRMMRGLAGKLGRTP